MDSGEASAPQNDASNSTNSNATMHPVHSLSPDHPFFGLTEAQYDYFQRQESAISSLSSQLSSLQSSNSAFESLTSHITALATSKNEDKSQSTKVQKPDTFHGQRSKLSSFLTTLRIYFSFNLKEFDTDRKKVLFACSLLRNTAFNWAEPYLRECFDPNSEHESQFFDDYEAFEHALNNTFGDIDRVAISERRLAHIKQKTSVTAYASEFQQVASHLGWDEAAICWHYYSGLKDSVKDEVSRLPKRPDNLEEFIEVTVRIDNRQYERKIEQASTSRPYSDRFTSKHRTPYRQRTFVQHERSDYYGPKPMEIDSIHTPTSNGKLSAEERKRRFDLNLCMFCGLAGHKVSDCYRANAKTSGTSSQRPRISANAVEFANPINPSKPITFSIPANKPTSAFAKKPKSRFANRGHESLRDQIFQNHPSSSSLKD